MLETANGPAAGTMSRKTSDSTGNIPKSAQRAKKTKTPDEKQKLVSSFFTNINN